MKNNKICGKLLKMGEGGGGEREREMGQLLEKCKKKGAGVG